MRWVREYILIYLFYFKNEFRLTLRENKTALADWFGNENCLRLLGYICIYIHIRYLT